MHPPQDSPWARLGQEFTRGTGPWRQRILVRRGAELRPLPVDDVAYFRSDDKLTLAIDRTGRESVVDATLNDLSAQLDPAVFARVNRQYLVAAGAVVSLRTAGKGRLQVTLNPDVTGRPVFISPENARRVREWLDS